MSDIHIQAQTTSKKCQQHHRERDTTQSAQRQNVENLSANTSFTPKCQICQNRSLYAKLRGLK